MATDTKPADGVAVPTNTPAPVAATAASIAGRPSAVTVPGDLKAAFALLAELDAMPETSAREQRAKQAAMAPLKRAIMAMQQGQPVLDLTADDQARTALKVA